MFNRLTTKTLALAALVPLGLSLVACTGGKDSQEMGVDAGIAEVVLSLSTSSNPFHEQLRDAAKAKADELGLTLRVLDANGDASKQLDQINEGVFKNMKAAILDPVDSESIAPAVKELNGKSIPVVAVERAAEGGTVASFVTSDNVSGGQQAAKALADAIGGKGEVIVLQGTKGSAAAKDRSQGFAEGIAKFSDIKVVAEKPAAFDRAKAMDVAKSLLQEHPNAVGIFAENDEMALGALEALGDKAGKTVKVVGFDGAPDAVKAVADGRMAATIAQQPKLLGEHAVEQAAKLAEAQPADAEVLVPVVAITKANVNDQK